MALNLFQNILNNINPQTKQAFEQTGKQLQKTFAPVTQFWKDIVQQNTQAIQPAIQNNINVLKNISEPVVQPIVQWIQRSQKRTKANNFLSEKWITLDDLSTLAESEWVSKDEVVNFLQSNWLKVKWMEELQAQQQEEQKQVQEQQTWADKFKLQSSENFGFTEWLIDIWKFFVNLPVDSAQVVWWLYDAVRHPVDTVTWIVKVWQGISDKAVFAIANSISSALGGKEVWPTQDAQMVDAIASNIKEKYWTAGKFKKAIVENPADTLLTLMWGLWVVSKIAEANNLTNVVSNINKIQKVINPVNILKQEAKIVTAPLKYTATDVIPWVLWKTTWTSAETIRTAFKQWGTKEFQSALRWETTPQNILSNVQEGMQAIKNNRSIVYGQDYAKLQANKTPLAINDVVENFVKSLKDEYKIKVTKNWLDFSQSKITWGTSQSQIESMYRDLIWWKDKTPEWLDVLKQRLQDYYRGTPESSKWDRLSTIASNAVKNKIVENVPEYENMTATYEKLTNDIRDITKTLSLWDKTQAQTAITKLNSVLRENFPARQDMVKIIEQYTWKNIQWQIAGSSLNPTLAKWLAGVITGWWIVFWQLSNPAFWAWLAVASPRLIWEIANTIGIPIEKFKTAINNIKKYVNTTSNNPVSNLESKPKIITPVSPKPQTNIVVPKKTIEKKTIVKPSPKVKPVEKTVKAQNLTPKKESATIGDMETKKLIPKDYKYIKKYWASSNDINIDARKWLNTEQIVWLSDELRNLPNFEWKVIRTSNSIFWKNISDIKVWDILSDKWFLSSSKTKSKVWWDYWDYEIVINSKTGKDITKIKWKIYDKYEPEILFDRNVKFVVKNIKWNKIYIEEI